VAFVGISLALFYWESQGVVELILNTTYPGKRFFPGGGFPFWPFLSHDFFANSSDPSAPWAGNVCESSSFLYIFPGVWFLLLTLGISKRKWFDCWNLILALYMAAALIYTYIGFPDWLARLTLFGMSTPNRTHMGLGIANSILLVAALTNEDLRRALTPSVRWIALAAWLCLLAAGGYWFRTYWPNLTLAYLCLGILFHGVLAFLWWSKELRSWGVALLAIASVGYTVKFNPLVKGGADFLFTNPISAKMLELDRLDQKTHRWMVIGDNDWISELPRMIGIKSLGGYHGHPHLPMWKAFDPEGKQFPIYNQCAFVVFVAGPSGETKFSSPSPGVVTAEIDPRSQALDDLGVRYLLATGDATIQLLESMGYKKMFIHANKAIFERF
jgi:hypothetical protein